MAVGRRSLLVASLGVLSRPAWTQTYPARPVRLVEGYGPGGAPDIIARLVGQRLSERLGQPFVIENKPGASGRIATEAVAKATPDGYTLLLVLNNNTVDAALKDKLPYDFIFGVRLRYVSGPLVTPVLGSIYDANGNYYVPVTSQQEFSRRLPDFFQMDLRLDKRFVFKSWMLSIYLDVQNVTNQQNVESVVRNYDQTKEAYLTGLPILPVLGMKGEW